MKYSFYLVIAYVLVCLPQMLSAFPVLPNDAREMISKAYEALSGYVIPQDEVHAIRTAGSDPTYGEITFEALQTILNDLHLTKTDVFYDLGCGLAQTCVQVALVTPATAKGIELSQTRIDRARQGLAALQKNNQIDLSSRVELKKADFAQCDYKDATVLFLCSTCFSDALLEQINAQLSKLPRLHTVITLRKLPHNTSIKLSKTYQLPMTWHKNTTVYVYSKKKS